MLDGSRDGALPQSDRRRARHRRVPMMIDRSKWSVIEAGLKCVQGKSIVNSISLKEGEGEVPRAGPQSAALRRRRRRHGVRRDRARPTPRTRKVEICERAYKLLTEKVGFPPEDIIFDPNILTVATGIEEHNNYAVDFIEAHTRASSQLLPHAQVSGGVSNISFSFRGNEPVREAMHAVFLYHAIRAGHGHGHRQRRPAGACTRKSRRICSNSSKTCCSIAAPTRPSGCSSSPRQSRPGDAEAGDRRCVARRAGRRAAGACAGQRHRRIHRRRHRRGAAEGGTAARRHRRPADGRHERRRRSVRCRQNVPAAGREERPRDEEGGRLSPAVHGSGKSKSGTRRSSQRARS